MPKPQQPELRRHDLGSTSHDATEIRARNAEHPEEEGHVGTVPPENQPGHRPEHDQDKPEGPPA